MMDLKNTQTVFQAYVIEEDPTALQLWADPAQSTTQARWEIYQQGYGARIAELLALDYPVLKHYLGEVHFSELVHAYKAAYPLQHFLTQSFGQYLSDFLKASALFPNKPGAHYLAALEYHVIQTAEANNAVALDFSALLDINPEQWGEVIFELHPSVRFLALPESVVTYWSNYQNKKMHLLPDDRVIEEPISYLIWRQNWNIHFHALSIVEKVFYENLQEKHAFSMICELLSAYISDDETVGWVLDELPKIFNKQHIVGLSLTTEDRG